MRLSALTLADFEMWRVILMMGFNDVRLLSVSWYLPPYAHMPHGTDRGTWSLRMAAQADLVGTRMRCTTPFGMALAPLRLQEMTRSPAVPWLGEEVPRDIQYRTADGKSHALDINLLEAIAVIACLIMTVQHILQHPRPTYAPDCERPFIHIHLWCDNSSAIWWLTCNRTASAFHSALFELFMQIQLLAGVVVTVGFIKGLKNTTADAVSRDFKTPHGPQVRALLMQSHVQRTPASLSWVRLLAQLDSSPSADISKRAHAGLTVAASVCFVRLA